MAYSPKSFSHSCFPFLSVYDGFAIFIEWQRFATATVDFHMLVFILPTIIVYNYYTINIKTVKHAHFRALARIIKRRICDLLKAKVDLLMQRLYHYFLSYIYLSTFFFRVYPFRFVHINFALFNIHI